MIKTGERYVAPGGAELVVTKGGQGVLSDGEVLLQKKGSEQAFAGYTPPSNGTEVALGKRYQAADGVSVLITKAGLCDLRYNGEPMELQQPRKLPSSD